MSLGELEANTYFRRNKYFDDGLFYQYPNQFRLIPVRKIEFYHLHPTLRFLHR